MSTIRERIMVALVAKLNTGTPGGVPQAGRTRLHEYQESDLPAIAVFMGEDNPQRIGEPRGPAVRSKLTVIIECRAKGTAGTRPDTAADALTSWVVTALAKQRLSDGGGVLCHDIVEGKTAFEYGSGEAPLCLATVEMVVDYQRVTDDPARRN